MLLLMTPEELPHVRIYIGGKIVPAVKLMASKNADREDSLPGMIRKTTRKVTKRYRCEVCKDRRVVFQNKAGDPDTGEYVDCPVCQKK